MRSKLKPSKLKTKSKASKSAKPVNATTSPIEAEEDPREQRRKRITENVSNMNPLQFHFLQSKEETPFRPQDPILETLDKGRDWTLLQYFMDKRRTSRMSSNGVSTSDFQLKLDKDSVGPNPDPSILKFICTKPITDSSRLEDARMWTTFRTSYIQAAYKKLPNWLPCLGEVNIGNLNGTSQNVNSPSCPASSSLTSSGCSSLNENMTTLSEMETEVSVRTPNSPPTQEIQGQSKLMEKERVTRSVTMNQNPQPSRITWERKKRSSHGRKRCDVETFKYVEILRNHVINTLKDERHTRKCLKRLRAFEKTYYKHRRRSTSVQASDLKP